MLGRFLLMRTKILLGLVIIQSVIIFWMTSKGFQGFKVVVNETYETASPLVMAVDYEASDRRFEELVKQYPELISNRYPSPDSRPILSSCAIINKTNYV